MGVIYGFYHGGDPREFSPDAECCTEKELSDHREACRLWDEAESRGETPTPEACESGWHDLPDGGRYHVLKSRYGIGTYHYDDEEDEPDEDDGCEPIGSCDVCDTNIYTDDHDGLCDQCAWAASQG